MLDRFFFHQNWFSCDEALRITAAYFIIFNFPKIKEVVLFGFFKIVREITEKKVDKFLLLKDLKDRVEKIGTSLKKMPLQIDGDERKKLEEIYKVPEQYEGKLSKEEMEEVRQLWNKYILREIAVYCLAFFDIESFGVKESERDKIKQSTDVYFPSPDRVCSLSKEAGFEQKMKQQGNERALEQFNVLFGTL